MVFFIVIALMLAGIIAISLGTSLGRKKTENGDAETSTTTEGNSKFFFFWILFCSATSSISFVLKSALVLYIFQNIIVGYLHFKNTLCVSVKFHQLIVTDLFFLASIATTRTDPSSTTTISKTYISQSTTTPDEECK